MSAACNHEWANPMSLDGGFRLVCVKCGVNFLEAKAEVERVGGTWTQQRKAERPITVAPNLIRDLLTGEWREVECVEHAPAPAVSTRLWCALAACLGLALAALWRMAL